MTSPGVNVRKSAHALNFTIEEIYKAILELESKDFHRSRTQPFNNKVWQDSYKKEIRGKRIYIKFKTFEGTFLLTSFKPDTSRDK